MLFSGQKCVPLIEHPVPTDWFDNNCVPLIEHPVPTDWFDNNCLGARSRGQIKSACQSEQC